MKKMNKKGFTLIEMLVVIAIIAILVAIIIPTVMRATDKAAAATNAANLRSYKAELVTAMLADDDLEDVEAPTAKECGAVKEGWKAFYVEDSTTSSITVFFAEGDSATAATDYTIDYFAKLAGNADEAEDPKT